MTLTFLNRQSWINDLSPTSPISMNKVKRILCEGRLRTAGGELASSLHHMQVAVRALGKGHLIPKTYLYKTQNHFCGPAVALIRPHLFLPTEKHSTSAS